MNQVNGVGQQPPAASMPSGPGGAGSAAGAGNVESAAGFAGAPATASGPTINNTSISHEVTSLMTRVGLDPGDYQVLRLEIAMMLLNARSVRMAMRRTSHSSERS